MNYLERTKSLMNVASGLEPADLVINGGRIFNVFTGEILDGLSNLKKRSLSVKPWKAIRPEQPKKN